MSGMLTTTEQEQERPKGIAVRLSWREWVVVLAVWCLGLALLPGVWERAERFEPGDNYRIAAGLRDDYALFARWCRIARRRHPALVLGDSVAWGRYVRRDDTLSAQLNGALGRPVFANVGNDGLHSVAAVGLLRHYGSAVRDGYVLLHLNPLWMQSARQDLSDERDFPQVNHPRLLPQFDGSLRCYQAPLDERLGVWAERTFPHIGLVNHVTLTSFSSLGLQQWMTDHPHRCPLAAVQWDIDTTHASDGEVPDKTSPWDKRNFRPYNPPWVELKDSRQWAAFEEHLRLLKHRNNRVFVLVGPFNPHILELPSRAKYEMLLHDMKSWLDANHPDYFMAPHLPPDEYGDSSHPLAPGYRRTIEALLRDERFKQWLPRAR